MTSCMRWAAGLLCAALSATPAQAQLRLPGGLPTLPTLPTLPAQVPGRAVDRLADAPLQALRRQAAQALLREHAELLEADPAGEPVLRGELLLVAPSAALLAAARSEGFMLLREEAFDGLDGLREVVLRAPPGRPTAAALAWLRAQDPALSADFNHVYIRSGDAAPAAAPPSAMGTAPAATTAVPGAGRVGLVDSGVDGRHPALRGAPIRRWGCDGAEIGSPHGTAVASLLVGRDGAFAGALPGATLHAADVYCGQPSGGSAERIVQALAWMARERVAVVNVSLVGPANRLLDQAVHALAARGHLVVAAVGNDGPAAPPLYPAACADALGVTGVNPRRRVLPEAAQGPQVAFAAPGAELAAAGPGGEGYTVVRGTSFAAPLVAGLLAAHLPAPDPAAARAAVQALAREALDLGTTGRDPVFGWGLIGEGRRVAPERVQARVGP